MKLIDISTRTYPGVFAMVDDADFDALSQWKWSAEKRNGTFYAIRSVRRPDGKKTTIRMHRQLVGNGVEVDHADGNGLNNQRENLRPCSVAENQQNRKCARGTSQYKGVMWDRFHNCWKAKIIVNGERIHLGSFKSEQDAALQYDASAKEYFGEFASLNFPPGEVGL